MIYFFSIQSRSSSSLWTLTTGKLVNVETNYVILLESKYMDHFFQEEKMLDLEIKVRINFYVYTLTEND